MAIDPRLVGERLQEHRRARALTQSAIAERLGTSRSNIAAIEAGQRVRLTPDLLIALADAYELSVSELVRVSPPAPKLAAQFRLPPESAPVDRAMLEAAISQLEELVARYLLLEERLAAPLNVLPAPDYSRIAEARDAEPVAEAERRRLALGDGPIETLRDVLERDLGIRSFSLRLPGSIAGVFGIADAAGPCLVFNSAHPSTRQRWTLAHELGHLLTHRDRTEITLVGGYKRVPERERFADAFAAAFLMPRAGIERRLRELLSRAPEVSVADLLVLANEYGVSSQALFLRLEGLGYIPSGEWDKLAATRVSLLAADRHLGLGRRPSDDEKFPRRYVLLAVDGYLRGLISEGEMAGFLDSDRLALRQRLADLARSTFEDEEGIQDVGFDLTVPVGFDGRSPA